MIDDMPKSNFFVSDLHMFSRRSQSTHYEDHILAAASRADTFVLGGDIFDFRWSTLASLDHTIEAAVDWLRQLAAHNGGCGFHFVLGNHDWNERFIARLKDLCGETENLSWHPYYIRLGQSLFLHGDVANRRTKQHQLKQIRDRQSEGGHERLPEYRHQLYDAIVSLRLHKFFGNCVNRPRRVARRIMVYLDDIGHGPESGVRNVYFGHTHAQMSAFEYGGLRFHNGGAPIKGLDFRIVEIEL